MKTSRFLPLSSACCLILASCEKAKSPHAGAAAGPGAGELAAERALIEEQRLELERERLAEERAALEEEKDALRAERETRLAAREIEAEWQDVSIEERQLQLAEREAELGAREEEFALRESSLSEQELELAGRDGLDDWEPEPLPELLEPVADYDTFYEDLQPYGSWYETPDYGYVYQPTVVVQDNSWRPYTRGRWACTNLGWNWISDEPFGWACFHYGRWALLDGRGWVWVPGDEWAPSWVCWREGSEHVGWAPLPPETLCFRGRGWDSSVEAEFGIGALCFNFVHRRHMADPLSRHCLPVTRNPDCIRQTNNITNIRFHRDRIIAGGPGYERLRHEVGKPWPVYQLETDRFRAIRDVNQRNAAVRGNRLAVFAPNLNTRWNDRLKPSRVAGRWDEVKVVRAESGIKPLWTERFREAREKRQEAAVAPADVATKVRQFEVNRQKVGAAQRTLEEKQQQLGEARREKQVLRRAVAREAARPAAGDGVTRPDRAGQPAADDKKERAVDRAPTLAERQREAADRLRETRARRTGTAGVAPTPATGPDRPPAGMTRPGAVKGTPEPTVPARGAVAGVGEETDPRQATNNGGRRPLAPAVGEAPGSTRVPRPEVTGDAATADNARRAQLEALRRQQQEQAVQDRGQPRPDTARNPRSPQMEQPRREAPAQPGLRQEPPVAEGNSRREAAEEARQQQLQAARERLEQARQQQAERQGNENAARLRQAEEARALQDQSRRAAEENGRGQQQEEMRRQQQEQARQQQEEMRRQQQQDQARQEQARQQQEEMRRQQQIESARQQQEEARRQQQQEQARQQQEEMRRQQQEQARQQQQERMREQQEEARRQNEERARQQQEERARQQEQARQQQEQARQQQEERARQQQEEQQRRQEERAREQSERQDQQRQRGR